MKLLFLVGFWTLATLSQAQKVIYKDCGSQVGAIDKVEIFPCNAHPCILHKGQSYTVNITFTPSESTDQCEAKVYGVIEGIPVPFPIPNPDACKNSGLACPLKSGSTDVYTATLPVSKLYPSIKVVVKWELLDKNSGGNKLVCMETLIAIM